MRAWDIRTAEQCGILERCKAFEKELLQIKDIVPDKSDDGIPFDLSGFLSNIFQVIIDPQYDIRADRDDYWEAAERERGCFGRKVRSVPSRGQDRGSGHTLLFRVPLRENMEGAA